MEPHMNKIDHTPDGFSFDIQDAVNECLRKIQIMREDPEEPCSCITWDRAFLVQYAWLLSQDAAAKSLNNAVRGLNTPLHLDSFIEKSFDDLSSDHYRFWIKRIKPFLNEAFSDIENLIYEQIGRPTYHVWGVKLSKDESHVIFIDDGDFRINQWEMEHLDEDECYVP
jgi:hypothetical protein